MKILKVLILLLGITFSSSFSIGSISSPSRRFYSLLSAGGSSILVNETFAPTTTTTYDDGKVLTTTPPQFSAWNESLAMAEIEALENLMINAETVKEVDTNAVLEEMRSNLKKQLAQKAITNFIIADDDVQPEGEEILSEETAETIMKQLEQIKPLPILRPATHYSLNADWSFVFTGVPTIGMKLITLLSRMSAMFPWEILDFTDVSLKVSDRQSKAVAIVSVTIGTFDWELQVCTSLRRPTERDFDGTYGEFRGEEGTLLLEHFQGIWLNGVQIPTPDKWKTTRALEITYMDSDIMIARTNGGEPHLLLRNSPMCYTLEETVGYEDEIEEEMMEECSIDDQGKKWTEFFSDAIEMYGKRLTRCLVDRDFGKEEYSARRRNRDNNY